MPDFFIDVVRDLMLLWDWACLWHCIFKCGLYSWTCYWYAAPCHCRGGCSRLLPLVCPPPVPILWTGLQFAQ